MAETYRHLEARCSRAACRVVELEVEIERLKRELNEAQAVLRGVKTASVNYLRGYEVQAAKE